MRRTNILLALAAASAVLVGCGSSSTATPSAAANSSTPAAAGTTGSAAGGGTTNSSQTSSSSSSSTASSSSSSSSSTAAEGEGLNAVSTTWIEAFCTNFTPVIGEINTVQGNMSLDKADLKKTQKALVNFYLKTGALMTAAGKNINGLPVPTINNGAKYGASAVKAFQENGPELTKTAAVVAAADTSDRVDMIGAVGDMSKAFRLAEEPLTEFSFMKVTKSQKAAMQAIPSCEKMKAAQDG